MIIDIHTHLAYNKIYPRPYLYGMVRDIPVHNKEKLSNIFLQDKHCDQLVLQMDKANIAKSVLLIIDGGIGIEEPELSLEEIYKLHYEVLKKHPNRFLVFAGIDPRRGKYGLDLFEKSIKDYSFCGLKLYPPMGYAIDSEALYEYYQICSNYKLPVLIHTGPSQPNLKSEFGKPDCIYWVANQFPNVNFILAHAGYNLSSLSDRRIFNLPNVFFDIAGFQSRYKKIDQNIIENLGIIFSEEYNSKILFGSDWPLFNIINPIRNDIQLIKELYNEVRNKVTLGLDNVLYKNAINVLNIK